MPITFKQFSIAYDAALSGSTAPDFLEEGPIWDKIKSVAGGATNLSDQELEVLHSKSVKGDLKARSALKDYFSAKNGTKKLSDRAKRVQNAFDSHDKNLDNAFKQASKAGTNAPKMSMSDRWAHVGKHD